MISLPQSCAYVHLMQLMLFRFDPDPRPSQKDSCDDGFDHNLLGKLMQLSSIQLSSSGMICGFSCNFVSHFLN